MLTDLIHRLTRVSNKDIFLIVVQAMSGIVEVMDLSLELERLILGVESRSGIFNN